MLNKNLRGEVRTKLAEIDKMEKSIARGTAELALQNKFSCSLEELRLFAQEEELGITDVSVLLGILGPPESMGPHIGFEDGNYILFSKVDVDSEEPDILCRHENWNYFLTLCAEYSDEVPGDDSDVDFLKSLQKKLLRTPLGDTLDGTEVDRLTEIIKASE